MSKARKKKKKKFHMGNKKTWGVLFLVLFTVLFIKQVVSLEMNIRRVKENIGYQQEVNNEVMAKRDNLENTVSSMEDSTFIENEARTRLGMLKPGEKLVRQITPGSEPIPINTEEAAVNPEP